ncbi:hypothetical protein [Desulfosporosinus acidiphilus]|uniref:hypothetical protein n=1 Tax=Desulfosporosinus acidiphilus TaxID=885581 RepID=UPI0011D252C9|nr:hypothetical protein [Desulfosporosinus acidiphilus]
MESIALVRLKRYLTNPSCGSMRFSEAISLSAYRLAQKLCPVALNLEDEDTVLARINSSDSIEQRLRLLKA